MSLSVSIACDNCSWVVEFDDADGVEYAWTDSYYGRLDFEDGHGKVYYEHLCEDCFSSEFFYCEGCDLDYYYEDGIECQGDPIACYDCAAQWHREDLEKGVYTSRDLGDFDINYSHHSSDPIYTCIICHVEINDIAVYPIPTKRFIVKIGEQVNA